MNLLRTADLERRLGLSRRAALKFLRTIDALPARDGQGRADYITTAHAVELQLTLRTMAKLSGQMPLDPLKKAAVEMALAAQLQHARELTALRIDPLNVQSSTLNAQRSPIAAA